MKKEKVNQYLFWIGLGLFVFGLWHLIIVGIIKSADFGPLITEPKNEWIGEVKLKEYFYYRMDYTYVPLFVGALLLINRVDT